MAPSHSRGTHAKRVGLHPLGAYLTRRSNPLTWLLAGIVLLVGVAYSYHLGTKLRYLDERVYVQLANYLVHGHGYTADGSTPTAYRPPGYPFMLAAVDVVHGGIFLMRMLNFAALAGTVVIVQRLTLRLTTPLIAVIAAAATACYPLFVYAAGTLYPQIIAGFLVLAALLLLLRATDPEVTTASRWRRAALAGILLGVLTEAVPTFGVTAVALCAVPLLRRAPHKWLVTAAAFALFAVLPVAWFVRNEIEMHAFIPVSTNNGVNLLLGNSEHANAFGGRVVDISQYENPAHAEGLGEVALDHRFTSDAVNWIKHHPAKTAVLYIEKLGSNFTYSSPLATSGKNSAGKDILAAVSFYPILALAIARIALWRRRPLRRLERGLIVVILGNVALLAVFYTRLRFRIPLDALTIIVAASGVYQLTRLRHPAPAQERADYAGPVTVGPIAD